MPRKQLLDSTDTSRHDLDAVTLQKATLVHTVTRREKLNRTSSSTDTFAVSVLLSTRLINARSLSLSCPVVLYGSHGMSCTVYSVLSTILAIIVKNCNHEHLPTPSGFFGEGTCHLEHFLIRRTVVHGWRNVTEIQNTETSAEYG